MVFFSVPAMDRSSPIRNRDPQLNLLKGGVEPSEFTMDWRRVMSNESKQLSTVVAGTCIGVMVMAAMPPLVAFCVIGYTLWATFGKPLPTAMCKNVKQDSKASS